MSEVTNVQREEQNGYFILPSCELPQLMTFTISEKIEPNLFLYFNISSKQKGKK